MAVPEDVKEKIVVEHLYQSEQAPTGITLSRGQKGGYAWDIRVSGKTHQVLIQELKQIDSDLKKEFGASQEETK